MSDTRRKVGLIINPIAGLGGRPGLKGSDGPGLAARALALGGIAESAKRAAQALAFLQEEREQLLFCTFGGDMGEAQLLELGFATKVLGKAEQEESCAQDTARAAQLLAEYGVELLLFAGGDGTARDICGAIGCSLPVIGIPAGVKMHSAVYAVNPRNAGLAAREYLRQGGLLEEAEVMDIDEELFRENQVKAKLYGYMLIPQAGERLQKTKAGGRTQAGDLAGLAAEIVDNMDENTLYLIGPGSTTHGVMEELGLPATLLGVDAVKNRRLLSQDISEREIWQLLNEHKGPVKIILTIIGGQGSLLGRGNQQFSPRILRRVGRENLLVIAAAAKLVALQGRPLLLDTGDSDLDEELCGYIRVGTGYGQSSYMPLRN